LEDVRRSIELTAFKEGSETMFKGGVVYRLFPSFVLIPLVLTGIGLLPIAGSPQGVLSASNNEPNKGAETVTTNLEFEPHAIASDKANPVLKIYLDPVQGYSSSDLVQKALSTNGELIAARLDIERARARLRQAGLRPNPSLDVEHMTGRLTGSVGESETSVGVSVPLEMGGKRRSRIVLAQAELEAAEAEVADRERRLAGEVLAAYAEAMGALRELEITEGLNDIDRQTAGVIEARVKEGETAPIELSLLQVEVQRLRSRRSIVEGRLKSTLVRLKSLTGIPINSALQLSQTSTRPILREPPATLEAATEIALRTRPDLRLARLNEEVAGAGLRLARAQAVPDISAYTRYTHTRSTFNETPVGVIHDRDRVLTFGVSIGIPVFNRNQGSKAEASVARNQAQARREYLEQVIRAEVASAYERYKAAEASLAVFEQGVINRSTLNIKAIRGAYEIGAFRVTDLLTEQRRLGDSQREFTDTLTERYRALTDLHTAMGAPVIQIEER
jgi:outer membrane protein, heavy metal efflux system